MQVQIPGYRIKKILGKGGMATVFLAVQEIFEREVALKVMSPSLAEDPSFGQRFMREARIVSQLVHANIVTVFDVGVHEDWYYLSMEYIPGPDLKQACSQLTLLQKIAVVDDVARALDFAGAKGYIHRDIKPENIILRDAAGRAVLMDFGIARTAEADLCVTQTGTSLGTPHYMSPEQARGQAVDHRSDLYSLGVVLYFLLMGQVPYHAGSAVAIGVKHITEPVPVLPGYLHLLNPIIARLMAKQPEERYQHAADLIGDLQRLDHKKLLKQYAQKSKYPAPAPVPVSAQPTVVHGASTRLVNAVKTPNSKPAPSTAVLMRRLSPWRWQIAAATTVMAAVVVVVGSFGPGEQMPAQLPMAVASQVEGEASASAGDRSRPEVGSDGESGGADAGFAESVGSDLSGLMKKFSREQKSLRQQVEQLRDQIGARNGDTNLQQKLDQLAQKQFAALDQLFAKGEIEKAQVKLKSLGELFPDYGADLDRYKQRSQGREQLEVYAKKAQQRMAEGKYLEPEDDSAEHYYIAMLELAPDLPEAHQGLVEMAKRTIAQANKDFLAGDWEAAQRVVDRLLALDPNHRASLELQKKITRYRKNETAIEQHLLRAQGHLSAGNLYNPKGDNAYAHYREVLALQPQHRAALEGLEQTHQALEEMLFAMIKRGDAALAREALESVRQARGDDRRLQQLRTEVEGLLEQHQLRPSPAISRLIVSSEPLQEMQAQQEAPLKLGQALYVGMEYDALAQGAMLQAVLYGPQGLAQANVPVVIEQPKGVHYFHIERPRKAFSDGQYQLKLVQDGNTLGETVFVVR